MGAHKRGQGRSKGRVQHPPRVCMFRKGRIPDAAAGFGNPAHDSAGSKARSLKRSRLYFFNTACNPYLVVFNDHKMAMNWTIYAIILIFLFI